MIWGVVVAAKIFSSLLISFLSAFYLVPLLCLVARKLQILDIPDGLVKKHKQPTPYLGGVAIYVAFIVALALTFPFKNQMFAFFVGSTLLLFIGLIDDLVPIKPIQKFIGQIIATLCFLRAGFFLKSHFFYNYWTIPFSFLWILSLINAFNLVDVMDGLATTLAICSSISFLVIALYFHQITVALMLCAFLGALLAFFWYNKPEARIYLGDAGSLFVGGFLATIPFIINWGWYTWYGFFSPIIILAIPILELVTLIVVRIYKGMPFYMPSPDHFSIYMQKNGWSKWNILSYVIILSGILFAGAFLFLVGAIGFLFLVLGGIVFMILWIMGLVIKKNDMK